MSDLQVNDTTPAPVEPQSTEVAKQPESQPEPLQPGTEPPKTEPERDEGKAAREAMQRRINRLTADKYQERAQREQLARELEQFRLNAPQEQQQRPQQQHYPQELIQQEAKRLTAEQKFTDQCNDFVTKGRSEFKDFDATLTDLASITGPFLDEKGQAEPLLQALLTTDAPHKVVKHLQANPDLAAQLVDLSPIQQARKLALIEQSISAKPTRLPSGAPKPLDPVTPAMAAGYPDPGTNTEEWIRRRNEDEAARRRR